MAKTSLDPSQIFYSEATLRNTSWDGKLIGEELDDYMNNRQNIGAIPPLPVTRHNNNWVTKNNRRLWICQHLQRLRRLNMIRVKIENFVPSNMQNTITIIGNVGGRWASRKANDSYLSEVLTGVGVGVLGVLGFALLRSLLR
ncbi:uncharacterized protein LOC123553812 [Mercenaria mercenaria]|uniref:uncharacterized protein LOC123553812 n=1 Tax=Mercenaria mercenaria TaxID=6596 RepID=UPI001E1E1947|nr:uncharacterized protein LOC123553812 [Mercenaria mercenaria]